MKGLLKFLIGGILGAALGWGIGFLRFPLIEGNGSFWVGFVTCLVFVLFVVTLIYVWNRNALVFRWMRGSNAAENNSKPRRMYALVWVLVALFIGLGGTVSSWLIYRQNQLMEARAQYEKQQSQEQAELIGSIRTSNQVFLMSNVLDNVDDDLKHNENGVLSAATIARVAALSQSFKPYRYFSGDSLSSRELSPERGQLLTALAVMEMDSVSFARIKADAPFSQADLRGAQLKGADLSGINLKGANLRDADLTGANLEGANMEGAQLWGTQLNQANLRSANLHDADLRWATLNGAMMDSVNLNGADLSNAQLMKVNMDGGTFRFGKSMGSLLNEATLTGVDMMGTKLTKANLVKANLSRAHLRWVNLTDAHLDGANWNRALVSFENWEKNWEEWKVAGMEGLKAQYKVVKEDSVNRYGAGYHLEVVEKTQ